MDILERIEKDMKKVKRIKNREDFTIKAKEEVIRVLKELEESLELNYLSFLIESEPFFCYFGIIKDDRKKVYEEGLISISDEGVRLYYQNEELDFDASEYYKIDDAFLNLYSLNFEEFVFSLKDVINKYIKYINKLNKEMKTGETLLKKIRVIKEK